MKASINSSPDIDATKIASGVLDPARIPNLDASKITTGVLDPNEIPNLDASKITTGTLGAGRIPSLDASQITTGKLAIGVIGATGTPSSSTFLRGDNTWVPSGTTIQSAAPTATTNGTLGQQIYATSNNRFYICIDATSNNNLWAYFEDDGFAGTAYLPPTGTLTNDQSASSTLNAPIADTDIIYAIGTNLGTTAFTNPADGTRITVTASGSHGTSGALTVLTDRTYTTATSGRWLSEGNANGWFQYDFGASRRVQVTRIALQQRGDSTTQMFRTVAAQYSSNGTSFTTATSGTASNSTGDWFSLDVTGFNASRYLRVQHTSQSSTPDNYFAVSEILIWGYLTNV
jgi:hypothetical protein